MNPTEITRSSHSLIEPHRLFVENQHYLAALQSLEQMTVELLVKYPSLLNTKTMKISSATTLDKEDVKEYLFSVIQILGTEKIIDKLNRKEPINI